MTTYRVQLHAEFGFDDAAAIAPYLARLGVTHLYTSPYLQAAPGSTHGYDVIDHTRVSSELGGPEAHRRMLAALRAVGLRHAIDVVPNHMSIASRNNRWWWDVLENGLSSPYARYFDVDWEPPEARLHNTVLLPVLADQYGRVLERGEITLQRSGPLFTVRYEDHEFPTDARSVAAVLRRATDAHPSDRLALIADLLELLPLANDTDPASVTRRLRDQEQARRLLAELLAAEPAVEQALEGVVAAYNADPDLLHALLDQQNYRLAWWQAAERDLGYRRFFDVNTLIGLQMDNPQVFRDTHRLILEIVESGDADILRIDHPDGLQDPEGYLRRLHAAAPQCGLLVEKILAPDEHLPSTWPVDGTTGYEFLNLAGGLFLDPAAEGPLTDVYAEFVGDAAPRDYATVARDRKLMVLREGLGSDVNRLAALLLRICENDRLHRDYTRHLLIQAIRELVASLPVYRTYVRPSANQVTDADRRWIDSAVADAQRARPDMDPELFGFQRALLLLETRGPLQDTFVRRFQQLSAAAMAKGVEDTAFYVYNRFVALNEVGGDPSRFGTSPEQFHTRMAEAHQHHPRTMLASSTHDTKRGEDVRARLAVLTECPDAWAQAVRDWSARAERHRTGPWPDRNAEYLYYQTLAGAWPLEPERAVAYMEKATREAKTHTSWTSPQEEYDSALRRFVEQTLGDRDFTTAVASFVAKITGAGRVVSLAQTLLKLTAPGAPDIYQGSELWNYALVDPDNRRPVDFAERERLLEAAASATADVALARADEGLPKIWLIRRALALRAARPAAFGAPPDGCYRALRAAGPAAERVIAFSRGDAVITVVPRLSRGIGNKWQDTALPLPEGRWHDVLSDERYTGGRAASIATLFARFPVALLEREEAA